MPDPNTFSALGWLFVALVGLVVGVNQIDDFFKRRRGSPANEELGLTAESLAQRIADLEQQRVDELKTGSERRQKIYAELKSQREDMLKLVDKIYDRIDRNEKENATTLRNLPNEIIATLRNTGVIK